MKNGRNIIFIKVVAIGIYFFSTSFLVNAQIACQIIPYAGTTTPAGFLVADGSSVSRSTYSELFTCLGTTYGSVDGSTFNLPDLRGRNIIGYKSTDTSFDTIGETGGEKLHDLTTAELPAHNHTITDPGHTHNIGNNTSGSSISENSGTMSGKDPNSSGSNTTGITINNTGSGTDFNVLDPYITINYLIAYQTATSSSSGSSTPIELEADCDVLATDSVGNSYCATEMEVTDYGEIIFNSLILGIMSLWFIVWYFKLKR